mgnify:CR=1 FL=1|tara:strand:- start:1438 stop:1563 length:126 start_codon:yes stop_codon:yes gene_type:complete
MSSIDIKNFERDAEEVSEPNNGKDAWVISNIPAIVYEFHSA